tara:strand:- start:362 stop:1801 length:1440 start_codon:yes stop_codon:yes gene_type:complete
MTFLIGGANTLDDAYTIDNSLRFNDNDSAFLRRTFSAGSRTTFTISFWLKRGNILTSDMNLFDAYKDDNNRVFVYFVNDDLRIFGKSAATTHIDVLTDRKFRDPSAWYHFVIAFDTTQGTEGNRIKVYVNGVQETSFSTYDVLLNYATFFNDNTRTHTVGTRDDSGGEEGFYDGYMSEVHYIDGAQKAASDFGETNDNGVWIPIKYSGSYGTNGYYLEFQQTGTGTASTSTIGADTSGNTNHLTSTNLAALDITVDTPTNNFATLNPLNLRLGKGITFSEGNTQIQTGTTGGTVGGFSTIAGLKSGKWYAEFKPTVVGTNGTMRFGIESTDFMAAAGLCNVAASAYASNGNKGRNATDTSHGDSFDDDDIIGVAVDLDNGAIYFSKNGTFQNSSDPESGASKTGAAYTDILTILPEGGYMFAFNLVFNNSQQENVQANFGNPCNAISSGNADGNGYGNFEYAVPSGYYSLCTKNLAEYG